MNFQRKPELRLRHQIWCSCMNMQITEDIRFITAMCMYTAIQSDFQEGETMNYRWLSYKEFVELVESDRFVPSEQERFCTNRAIIERS